MELLPLFINLLALVTGVLAIGEGTRWNFSIPQLFHGDKLAMIYCWVICSTSFSMVHFIALLTSAPIIGMEPGSLYWVVSHTLIGCFFTSAHVFIDAVFEDRQYAHDLLGVPST